MNNRLTNMQVDELADELERSAGSSKKLSFMNYQMAHDPARTLGIMRADGLPREGLTTAASFGLAHEDWSHANFADRFELVQARDNPATDYERIVVAAVEGIISSRRVPKAGLVCTEAVASARLPDLAARMPHATLIFPYLWEHFSSAKLSGGVRVWFMQVVPIFEAERRYLQEHGFAEFEQLIVDQGVHFHKLNREPYVVG